MKTRILNYENNPITFNLKKDNGVMINATEMAKPFGKEVARFMENDSTKNFISACLKTRNSSFINIENESELFTSIQKSGTFMHRILALKFAAWLSPDFEVWVYSTIEEMLFGKHVEREKSLERTIELKAEIEMIRDKPDKTGEDLERYIIIERELRIEQNVRKSLTSDTMNEMADMFEGQNN